MKQLILLSLLASFALISSCDRCKKVACLNDGACQQGECICPEGYTGENCEREDKCVTEDIECLNGGVCDIDGCQCGDWYTGEFCGQKYVNLFLGTYKGTENCGEDFENTYVVSEDVFTENELLVEDGFDFKLILTFDPGQTGTFTIRSRNQGEEIWGDGACAEGQIKMTYTVQLSENETYTCEFRGSR